MAIQSFGDRQTRAFFLTGKPPRAGWAGVAIIARRKLDMLDYAAGVMDLRSPPGNRLEKLAGSLRGYYSIRINQQWRVVFRWTASGPEDVRVVDYHK